ncbi:hypothetical protein QR680_017248 [Steinernema hermaphroditum]|uniref:Uncharacterized protein n=1 Tax=Steinernema hermaphroditum TaxID=289476 RepID=A0AA39LP11_9BILA|nr:hypothetical protein QR680_017248 [Steinernema hermaphroditum]
MLSKGITLILDNLVEYMQVLNNISLQCQTVAKTADEVSPRMSIASMTKIYKEAAILKERLDNYSTLIESHCDLFNTLILSAGEEERSTLIERFQSIHIRTAPPLDLSNRRALLLQLHNWREKLSQVETKATTSLELKERVSTDNDKRADRKRAHDPTGKTTASEHATKKRMNSAVGKVIMNGRARECVFCKENHFSSNCTIINTLEGRKERHTMQQNNEAAGAVKVTDDVKAHIIDLVKHKDILWKVKSRGEDIQNIFKNLKDSYMRRLKSAKKAMGNTGDGAKSKKREDKFIFADELEFLLENESDLDINRPLKAIHKDHFQLRALSLSSAVEDDLDDAFNNEIHTPIRKRRREQRSSRADEELASVLRTLAEENKKNKYEHFADEVACCLKTVEDRNPTLALDMKRQIQEVCYNFEKKSLDLL